MKELITEEQANQIILLLSILVALASLGYGFYRNATIEKSKKKLFWAYIILFALMGPVIWVFWQVYNSIENYYGLDSLKALGINFLIALGIAVVFMALFYFVPRWVPGKKVSPSRK